MKCSPRPTMFVYIVLACAMPLLSFSPCAAQAVSFPLAASTGAASKIDLGAFAGGTILRLDMSGTVSLLNGSDYFTRADGSLVIPVASSLYQYAHPGASGYPTSGGGDGINHYPGGGANIDVLSGFYGFAGLETTDTTAPATIRHGAVVATFTPAPSRSDWFLVGTGRSIPIPTGGAHLYVAVNDSDSANNVGFYLGDLSLLTSISELRVPSKVPGGKTYSGKVILSAPAPTGGAVIALSTTNPATTLIPTTLTIPAGQIARSFKIITIAVTSSVVGDISATYNGGTVTNDITVRPIGVSGVALSPNPVKGGNTVLGIVTLELPAAPGDILVTLASSNTAAATVGASVTIPAGATSAFFTVNTNAVSTTTSVNISATANGITRSRKLTITP